MEAMIETTVLTKLRGMPDFQKRQVLDFVEFLEAKAPEFASEQVDRRQEPVATANLLSVDRNRNKDSPKMFTAHFDLLIICQP
jgi:hypothetical protein